MLEARLSGQFDVRLDGKPVEISSRTLQSLFAYLLLNAGTVHRREKLAGLLWPEVPDDVARRNLRQSLFVLRKSVELGRLDAYLGVDEISVGFILTAPYWLDVSEVIGSTGKDGPIEDLLACVRAYAVSYCSAFMVSG